jgi:hypothetical protein
MRVEGIGEGLNCENITHIIVYITRVTNSWCNVYCWRSVCFVSPGMDARL